MNDILGIMIAFVISFGGLLYWTYDNLEYKGYPRVSSCTGECYEEYVRTHGTVVEQLQRQQAAAAEDPFSSIRGLWSGGAACHGQSGEGMGAFPKLAGQNSDYIIQRLTQYKNSETVGQMSATMWAQAGQLSQEDIETLGEFIQETMK